MSGIGMILDIAKGALAAQSYGLDVTAHNIANVNTDGYSRQRAVFETNDPYQYGGALLGRGTNVSDVVRTSDQFIDNQVAGQKGNLAASLEMENYMRVLEGLFNENSNSSISTMMADFWNLWHDLTNNPSGDAERIALYEHSVLMAEQFNTLDADLSQLQTDLTNAVSAAIGEINRITSEIGDLNNQIVGMEIGNVANDLRDKRNHLVWQLSEYLDVKSFEQNDGALTVVSAMGCVLVNGRDNYELNINGSAVEWTSSSGSAVDITNHLSTGKVGGWLDIRDEIIAKYKLDLDALTEEFAWAVNKQHSQGVGLVGFSSVTGTNAATTPGNAITASGLDYQDKVDDTNETFQIWLFDTNGVPYDSDGGAAGLQGNPITITVTAGMTLNALVAAIDGGTGVQASLGSDNKVTIGINTTEVATLGSLAFANDNSNVLSALGINTFFAGATAGGIGVNTQIGTNKDYIAAAQVDTTVTSSSYGTFATGNNANARAIADLQYTSQTISQWTVDRVNGNTEGSVTTTIENYFHSLVSSIGTQSASVSRTRDFNEVMTSKLESVRDSISAVNLDEEMTNMMKFQHAYTAASKLISVADELLTSLLATK
jgi:flagellar hook-associated protein FlgK